MKEKTKEGQLMSYMMGWKCGAKGSAFSKEQMVNEDFKAGHDDGRKSSRLAYLTACGRYGTALSVLRTEAK